MKRQELVDFIDESDNMFLTNDGQFVKLVKWENGEPIIFAQIMTTAFVDAFGDRIEPN